MAASKEKTAKITFGHILRSLDSSLCTRCGTCVVTCAYGSVELGEEGGASLVGTCGACGLCYFQCPQFTTVQEDAEKIFEKPAEFEGVGIYKNAYSAKTKISEIEKNSQDGGVVTSLPVSLLEEGFIDGAVITGVGEEPWKPEPQVAISREEIIENAGTIYSPSSVLKGLRVAVDNYGLENLAVVGTPCQVKGLRRMEIAERRANKYESRVKLIIGLFCMESFPYENIVKIVENELGLKISEVTKFDIEKGDFIVQTEDQEETIPVGELKDFMNSFCRVCLDFAAELADVSVGNVGVPAGYNAVLTRTNVGEEAFQRTVKAGNLESEPLKNVKPGLELIEKLSNKKKQNRKEEIERRKENEEPIPPSAENSESG